MVHATRTGTLLLAAPDSTLFRSTDMGTSWSIAMTGLYWSTPPVDDSSGGIIYAGLHNLYRSTDDGLSWSRFGSTDDEISALAVGSDGRLAVAVERSFSPRGVRVSTDLGATWSQVQIGDSNTPTILALAATPDGALFAGTGGGGLFRSDDGGSTWSEISIERYFYYSAFAVPADRSLVVATSRGVYRSTDRGSNWQMLGNPDIRQPLSSLVPAPGGRILAGSYSAGIYAFDGDRWRPSSRGLPPSGSGALVVSPDRTLYTVTGGGRFFSSSDNGRSWVEPDYSHYFPPVLTVDAGGTLYASNTIFQGLGVIHSTDRGATWTVGNKGMENEMVLALLAGDGGKIYAAVERGPYTYIHSETDGLFLSTDRGDSWRAIGRGLQGITPQSIVELHDGTLFVGSRYDPRVMRLLPGDTLWQGISSGLPPQSNHFELHALIADGKENLYAATHQGLFRSSDRGSSWQRTGVDIADTSITALALSSTGRIFAATILHGVYASDDNGTSWHYLGDAPGVTGFDLLAVDSSGGLIAGSALAGLYRAVATSSVPNAATSISAGLAAHPNPAGSLTSVEFEMVVTGYARLTLYSSAGQQVAVIDRGERSQGIHRIECDLSRYAPVIYHLQLETAQGNEQIGIIIVR
jgi:photosystem II stability/assembly factor-like uncharacterized protein